MDVEKVVDFDNDPHQEAGTTVLHLHSVNRFIFVGLKVDEIWKILKDVEVLGNDSSGILAFFASVDLSLCPLRLHVVRVDFSSREELYEEERHDRLKVVDFVDLEHVLFDREQRRVVFKVDRGHFVRKFHEFSE